jgi:tetratricopeptide (TPR) repeat protein
LTQASAHLQVRRAATKEQAEAIRQFKENKEKQLKAFGDDIQQRRKDYAFVAGSDPNVLVKLENALIDQKAKPPMRGLVGQALKLLQEAKIDALKNDPQKLRLFVSWQIYLLLTTGHAREAHDALQNEELRNVLPQSEYEELRALAAAALGDYPAADQFLEQAEKGRRLPTDDDILEKQKEPMQHLLEFATTTVSWLPGSEGPVGAITRYGVSFCKQRDIIEPLYDLAKERRDASELRLIRGLLALEAGDTAAAAKYFQACLRIVPPAVDFPDRVLARRYLELLEVK